MEAGRPHRWARPAIVLAFLACPGCHAVCPVRPASPRDPNLAAWDAWGRARLRDGDLAFRMGNARAALGLLPFSRYSAALCGSSYSHAGVVAIEGGEPFVYDTEPGGPRRTPWVAWAAEADGHLAVKRPRPAYAAAAPGAVAFCRDVFRRRVPYDRDFRLGDDRFYCVELVARAYEAAGLPLAPTMRLDALPRYRDFRVVNRLVRLATPIEPSQQVFIIGNDSAGLWSSPALELVVASPESPR